MRSIIIVCCLFILQNCFCQKVGYVNTQLCFEAFPEVKKFNEENQLISKKLIVQDSIERGELVIKADELAKQFNQSGTISKVQFDLQRLKVQQAWNKLDTIKIDYNAALTKKTTSFYKPIYDKISEALKQLCKEQNYTLVFDTSGSSILFGDENVNLLKDLKLKLNIK